MQTSTTPLTTQPTSGAGRDAPALHPIAALTSDVDAKTRADSSAADAQPATKALLVGADTRALEVHYELDHVANVWVAHILDAGTGEVVRQVPSTRVLHQLAELTHAPRVDRRA